jgi:DNA adenine methylase
VRYLGGKSRIAKRIAAPINEVLCGRPLWEPFCGGLGMSAAWDHPEYLLLTDACLPLISMLQAYDAGWEPPTHAVLEPERKASLQLPDTDPLKAFYRFGCGFGGCWHGTTTHDGMANKNTTLAAQSSRSLARTFGSLGPHGFDCVDFCAVEPYPMDGVIYCDPPYAGQQGYKGTPPFDHWLFYERLLQWASMGADVFVSEFTLPDCVGTCILEIDRQLGVRAIGAAPRPTRTERLYWVEP